MMLTPLENASPTPLRIALFLNTVDRTTELLGLDVPQIIEIEKLRTLPPGTFGRAIADFLDRHQLTPFTKGARAKQLHDSVHVLTDYDTDPLGEAEVQAFLLGAKFRLRHLLIGLGTLRLIRQQCASAGSNYAPSVVRDRLWRAYQRGKNSHFDLDTWTPELQWEWSLARVRDRFNL
jgi:ubiquinone biosynthesis protein COQ4